MDEAAVDDEADGGLPEVIDFFDANYGCDWEADDDIVRLRRASLDNNSNGRGAGSGGSGGSLRNIHIHRVIRVKEAVRDVIPDVFRSAVAAAASSSPPAPLSSLPLLITRIRVSSDVQWVTVEWTLVPCHAESSLCRLPASLGGMSLQSVLSLVAAQLTSTIAAIRAALCSRLKLRYVPHVRFVYGDEWRRRRSDRQRQKEIDERLSDGGSGSSQAWRGEEAVEDEVGFHRFNPFTLSARGQKRAMSAHLRPSHRAAGIVSEQRPTPQRRDRRGRQQRRHQQAPDDVKRSHRLSGQQRYVRPVQQFQHTQRGGSRPPHVKRDDGWIKRQQQRALWESL